MYSSYRIMARTEFYYKSQSNNLKELQNEEQQIWRSLKQNRNLLVFIKLRVYSDEKDYSVRGLKIRL